MSTPDKTETLATETVFRGRVFSVQVSRIRKPGGGTTTREVVVHSDVVVVVPLDADRNALLVRQYRFAVGKELLELPAGGIEHGETPEDCVRRELREETAFLPHRVTRLGGFYSAPGFCSEYLHLFLATDLERSPLHASDTDEIHVERVPVERTPGLIASGQIEDSKSIAGLLTVLTFKSHLA
ncbi:MAG: NUDIX hydrolase [Chloroflexi bacterium]|nr:NUDIX hydrolase [Chloroflexota bacterium]